jgi:DNA polymerase-3 subunit epsilon|tara:strand:+ start:9989 stop:10783 length:795 start_codon:yes stop_codon:yes gene_type:complete
MDVNTLLGIKSKLKLKRDTIFFDLETTGRDPIKDRIIQIGVVKIADGEVDTKSLLINPKIPIPADASEVHGIFDDDVKDSPTFKSYSKSMAEYFKGCDLAGYNSDSFDISFLVEAFSRVDIDFPEHGTIMIDALRLERHLNGHKLGEVYANRTGKSLENAHDALADTIATVEVFAAQMDALENEGITFDSVPELYAGEVDPDKEFPDFPFNKVYVKEGVIYFNVGKHKDTPLLEIPKDYIDWMIGNKDNPFPTKTLNYIKGVMA